MVATTSIALLAKEKLYTGNKAKADPRISLHISMQRVVDAGLFKGIQVGSSLQVSHLFYADDVVFMGHWSEANIDTILRVLDCFYHASGLRINMLKSKLMRISVSSDKVDQAAKKIGCAILQVPFSYLGSKVGCLMSRIQSWSEIVNNILTRLSKWKLKTLSIGGRLTLLKSVLGSLPIYHMSLFKVPAKVLLNMESIRCHFFNGIEHNGKKPIWVKWNKVLASKEKGGLGVSSFYALNRALLFKWVWRFCTQQSALWTKIIKGIHGEDGKIGKHVRSHHPSLWLDIVKEVQHIQRQGTDLMGFIHRKMGNGVDIRFWEDKWRGDNTFQSDFPRMYALETQKNISVALKLSHDDLLCSFRRAPRAGAEELQYIQLVKIMEGITLFDSKDRWRWSLEGCGEFTVASVRNLLDANSLPVVSSKTRWIKAVPIKVNIHAWKVKLDILPTRLNISKRGMDIESILCPLCEKNVESSSHIFFTCPISREIFRKVLLWWEIDVVMVSSYDEWLEWLLSIRLHSKHKELFEGVCYVLWWYIWNFRNKSIFGSACPSKALIFEETESNSGADMANTVMQKFWDSALNLDPPDDYDDSQSNNDIGWRGSLGLGNSFAFNFEDLRGRVHRFTFGTENLSELVSAVTHRMGGNIDHSPQLLVRDMMMTIEGDRVLLTTDSDMVGAVNHARSAGQKVLRLHLDNSEFGQRKRESQLGTVMEERTTENPKSSHVQTGILASAAVIAGIACVVYLKRNIVGRSMKFLPFASGVLFVRLMT
ncbi:RNA-directed DNA polymerase, eukaryota, reverse transcriptase zinc-binding domain protein [Tanacetum coccineum]